MKKLPLVLLPASLLTLAIATPALAQGRFTTWKNRSHNLEWKMPGDWKVKKNEASLFFSCEPQDQYCIEIGFSKGRTLSARQLANRFVSTSSAQSKVIKLQRPFSQIAGFTGHALLYTAVHNGKPIQTIVIALSCKYNDSNAVFSLWWNDHPRYNSVKVDFAEKVAKTLRLIPNR